MLNESIETTERFGVAEFTPINKLVNKAFGKFEADRFGIHTTNNLVSGFNAIDNITGGFSPGELVCIAVRPGLGKTAFMLSLLHNTAVGNENVVVVFSPERSGEKIVKRLIESQTGHSMTQITEGRLKSADTEHALTAIKNISKAEIYIDDSKVLSVEELIGKTWDLKSQKKVDLIIIDYLQLMAGGNNEEMSNITLTLKNFAKEIQTPIVIFYQLSSEMYNHKGSHPAFRYTPSFINENTDTLMFLNRPDFYHINEIDRKEKGLVEITIAKNKNISEPEMVNLRFIESIDKYTDIVR